VLSLPVKTHSYLPVILVPPVKGATITPNPIRVAVLFTQPRDYVSPRKKKKKKQTERCCVARHSGQAGKENFLLA